MSQRLPALVGLLAVAACLGAMNIHYAQPLLPGMAADVGASLRMIGLVPTASQLGFALGIVLILPLADMLERRALIVGSFVAVGVALALTAAAPAPWMLVGAAFLIGLAGIGPQLLTPYAALLAPKGLDGRAVGLVLSGVMFGILLSKVVAGAVAEGLGWRALYGAAAVLMAALAAVLALRLPVSRPARPESYGALMRSILGLIAEEPALRRHALYGALGFAAFMAFWTTYAIHLQQTFGYGPGIAGLFGFAGLAGTAAAALAGRQIDHGRFGPLCLAAGAIILGGYVLLASGAGQVSAILCGVILVDFGFGLIHAANQSSAFKLRPAARGRINSVYMAGVFLGGAAGTFLASALFAASGWLAVCALGAVCGGAILAMEWTSPVRAGITVP